MSEAPQQIVKIFTKNPDSGELVESGIASPITAIQTLIAEQAGFFRELMQNNLAQARLVNEVNRDLMEELRDMRRSRREDTTAHIAMIKTLESMLSEQSEREDRRAESRENSEQKRRIVNEGLAIAPVALRKLLGIKVTEGMPDAVKQFLSTLEPKQIDVETGTIKLDPGQLVAMGTILEAYREEEEAREAKEKAEREKSNAAK